MVTNKKNRHVYNLPEMAKLLEPFDSRVEGGPVHCFIERAIPMPSVGPGRAGMGASSAFSFGGGYFAWLMGLVVFRMPYTIVQPAKWKKIILADMGEEKS